MARSLKRKIAIGVVLALIIVAILGIVTGVFQHMQNMVTSPACVSNPINELVETIQKAQAGAPAKTMHMCMYAGEMFEGRAVITQMTNLASVSFNCNSGAAVCKNNDALDLSNPNRLSAKSRVIFKGLVTCTKLADSGNYDCTVEIQSA